MRALAVCLLILPAAMPARGGQSCDRPVGSLIDSHQARGGVELATAPSARAAPRNADDPQARWLALAADIQADPSTHLEPAQTQPATAPGSRRDWKTRTGPPYPGDFWHCLGRDAKDFPAVLWDDTKATATNPVSLLALTIAGVTGITLSGANGNDQVQEHFERHGSQLNSEWDSFGSVIGQPGVHFAAAGLAYLLTLDGEHNKTHEATQAMISALALTGIATTGLKVAARTESPNGDEYGWPSGHASSSFAVATVLAEYYGPWAAIPAFGLASFVGYERLDARNHDFSDVISGAFIGIAFGHAVAKNHMPRVMGMDLIPYATPDGGAGLALYGRR